MDTITVTLPGDVAAQLEAERLNEEQLDSFLVAAVRAWLIRGQATKSSPSEVAKNSWPEVFRDSAVAFVEQLIDENRALFEELARL